MVEVELKCIILPTSWSGPLRERGFLRPICLACIDVHHKIHNTCSYDKQQAAVALIREVGIKTQEKVSMGLATSCLRMESGEVTKCWEEGIDMFELVVDCVVKARRYITQCRLQTTLRVIYIGTNARDDSIFLMVKCGDMHGQ